MNGNALSKGFQLLPQVLGADRRQTLIDYLSGLPRGTAGRRDLLEMSWCQDLARGLHGLPELQPLLPAGHVAVQCTLFEKSPQRNWLVTPHQDLAIPVARRVDDPALSGWSVKEGCHFVLAPAALLAQLVALRLHLDDATVADGGLRFVPGSHRDGILDEDAIRRWREQAGELAVDAYAGDVLAMSPLVLHASSKGTGQGWRRVLHLLYGPRELPHGLQWHRAV